MNGGTEGESRRRSGRRSSEPLQHIAVGGRPAPGDEDDASAPAEPEPPDRPSDERPPRTGRRGPASTSKSPSKRSQGPAAAPPRGSARTGSGYTRAAASIRTGLDRIKPRPGPASPAGAAPARGDIGSTAADRDPLGRAALYSSGAERHQPALGTFLLECSACRRETPVTAGDLIRLGVPSFHLPFVKRFPSLMRCPACGRRTWLRVHWQL